MNNPILMIDDDTDLCRLVQRYLQLEGYQVTLCHDGESGLREALRPNVYHLVILDVMLPKISGFDLLAQLRQASAVPVLMLTAKGSEGDKVSGLRIGADDYLTKPFASSEFIARVQSLIRRYTVLNPSTGQAAAVIDCGSLHIDPGKRTVQLGGKEIILTAKEFDLLCHFAANPGRVFTKKQIYRAVWEDEYAFDDNNIMVHIRRLRKKIEPDPENPALILTVWGVGYKFGGES